MAAISFVIACIVLKIAQIAEINQTKSFNLWHQFGHTEALSMG